MQDKRKDKIIEIVNLTRQFDDGVVAVDDISFYVLLVLVVIKELS